MIKFKRTISPILKKIDTDLSIRDFVDIELRLFILYIMKSNINPWYGWSVFTKYFNDFKEMEEDQKIHEYIFKLKKQSNSYSKNSNWNSKLLQYLNIDRDIRIFDVIDEELVRITAKFEDNREEIYERFTTYCRCFGSW